MSELDLWDADDECSHGRLPWQECSPCGREGRKRTYPGVRAVAESERQEIRQSILAAVTNTNAQPYNERKK